MAGPYRGGTPHRTRVCPAAGTDRDQLLTNVTVYWLTTTAGSSARLYHEAARSGDWGAAGHLDRAHRDRGFPPRDRPADPPFRRAVRPGGHGRLEARAAWLAARGRGHCAREGEDRVQAGVVERDDPGDGRAVGRQHLDRVRPVHPVVAAQVGRERGLAVGGDGEHREGT